MSSMFITNKNNLNGNVINNVINQEEVKKDVKKNKSYEDSSYKVSIDTDEIKSQNYSYEIYHIENKKIVTSHSEKMHQESVPNPSLPRAKNFFLQHFGFSSKIISFF